MIVDKYASQLADLSETIARVNREGHKKQQSKKKKIKRPHNPRTFYFRKSRDKITVAYGQDCEFLRSLAKNKRIN